MKFASWDRLLEAFGGAETAVPNKESGEAEAAVVVIGKLTVRIGAGLGDQVGRRLFKAFSAECRLPIDAWDAATLNRMNNESGAIARSVSDGIALFFPMAANELGSESDGPQFIIDSLNWQRARPAAPREIALQIEEEFSRHVGLVDDADAFVRSLPQNDDMIFASRDVTAQRYHFNMVMSESFLEDAAVRDLCGHLVSADFYDPHYRSTALNDVDQAQARGRSIAYKLFYANHWNNEQANKYWRLRATMLGDRMVFRMPFLVPPSKNLNFARELDAINLVVSQDFHYRGRTWQPIRTGNPLTMLGKHVAIDLLRRAFS